MHASLALISKSSTQTNLPNFKVGQTVRLHQKIKEGDKQRIQVFEGIIIKTAQGRGINGTITVRKIVDGIGIERVFPIHSPLLAKIELTKEAKVRRSKLYFLRERSGKSARLKTNLLEDQVFEPKRYEEEAVQAEETVDQMSPDAEAPAAAEPEAPTEAPAEETAPAPEAEAPAAPAEEPAPAPEAEAPAEEKAPEPEAAPPEPAEEAKSA